MFSPEVQTPGPRQPPVSGLLCRASCSRAPWEAWVQRQPQPSSGCYSTGGMNQQAGRLNEINALVKGWDKQVHPRAASVSLTVEDSDVTASVPSKRVSLVNAVASVSHVWRADCGTQ